LHSSPPADHGRSFSPSYVRAAGTSEPAPIGIADLGRAPGGSSTDLTTDSFVGRMTIDSVRAYNASIPTEADWISFQLNVFLVFPVSGQTFVYWVQDVLEVNTSDAAVEFFDNIWNATSPGGPSISSTAVSGGGSITPYNGGSYYADGASCLLPGACSTLSYPATVTLEMNASVGSHGSPTVAFRYDDGSGLTTYDTVTFVFAQPATGPSDFEVNAGMYSYSTCPRCYGDAELVAGGPDSGYDTTLDGTTDVLLSLQEWNGNNYAAVPAAYDYGISTAEGLQNAAEQVVAGPGGVPEAELTNAAGSLGPLWSPSTISEVEVGVETGRSGGTIQLNTSPAVGFSGTFVSEVVLPGSYSVSVTSGGTPYSLGNVELVPGEELTLEVGAPPVVFVPQGLPAATVWTVDLNGENLSGTGNLTFGEVVGNYTYSVAAVAGYTPNPSSGVVSVPSNGTRVEISWTAGSPGFLAEIASFLLAHLVAVGAIALLLVLAAAVFSLSRSRHRSRTLRTEGPGSPVYAVTRPAPRSPTNLYCPHCGAPRSFAFSSCPRCGWRPPPAPPQ
jgi:Thermopsin